MDKQVAICNASLPDGKTRAAVTLSRAKVRLEDVWAPYRSSLTTPLRCLSNRLPPMLSVMRDAAVCMESRAR